MASSTPSAHPSENQGRIFFSNADEKICINIGGMERGQQLFPEWIPSLESVISRQKYDALVSECMTFFRNNEDILEKSVEIEERNIELCCYAAPCFIVAALGFCVVDVITLHGCNGALIDMNATRKKLRWFTEMIPNAPDKELDYIAQKHNATFKIVKYSKDTTDERIDQYGKPLEKNFGHRGKITLWPPLGVNVIIIVPKEKLNNFNLTWRNQNKMVSLMANPMAVAGSMEMARSDLPRSPDSSKTAASRIQELVSLKDSGLITEKEFDEKRSEILSNL